jgi:hypothetical protein
MDPRIGMHKQPIESEPTQPHSRLDFVLKSLAHLDRMSCDKANRDGRFSLRQIEMQYQVVPARNNTQGFDKQSHRKATRYLLCHAKILATESDPLPGEYNDP